MDWASLLDGIATFALKLGILVAITAAAAGLVLGFERLTAALHWRHRRHS